jgi:hypothetical protein
MPRLSVASAVEAAGSDNYFDGGRMPHQLQGDSEQADRDAYRALACAADVEAYLALPDILECLATLAGATGSHREAAGLFGAADALRERVGAVRFKIYDAEHESAVASFW